MSAPARRPSAISRLTSLRKPRPFSPSYSKPCEPSVKKTRRDRWEGSRLSQWPFLQECFLRNGDIVPRNRLALAECVLYACILGKCEKRKRTHRRCGIRRFFHKCLVIAGPNTKTRNEGNRVGRPLSSDRSATIIGWLGHHVETRNRKPAGTSMATCVLPICSARQRETPVILFFFFHPGNLCSTPLRTFLSTHSGIPRTVEFSSFPAVSSAIPGRVVRGNISRNLRRFCCTGLSPRVLLPRDFQTLFRIRLGKLHEIPSEERFACKSYKKADTMSTESSRNRARSVPLALIPFDRISYGLRETNPQTCN